MCWLCLVTNTAQNYSFHDSIYKLTLSKNAKYDKRKNTIFLIVLRKT